MGGLTSHVNFFPPWLPTSLGIQSELLFGQLLWALNLRRQWTCPPSQRLHRPPPPGQRVGSCMCVACQWARVHQNTNAHLHPFLIPVRRFHQVHVDLVGPLPSTQGFTQLLTVVAQTTRGPEAGPLTSTTPAEVPRAFLSAWVASHLTSPWTEALSLVSSSGRLSRDRWAHRTRALTMVYQSPV